MSLNNWCGMGRITRDIEKRVTPNGKSVANFTIAVDRDFKGQDGQRETDFIDIVTFAGVADFCASYLGKGRMVVVEGRLQIREWKAKDGTNRRTAEIVANNVYFADSKRDNAQGGQYAPSAPTQQYAPAPAQQYAAQPQYTGGFADLGNENEDDLPFN